MVQFKIYLTLLTCNAYEDILRLFFKKGRKLNIS